MQLIMVLVNILISCVTFQKLRKFLAFSQGCVFLINILALFCLSTTEYKCVVFYRRSGDIIEIQEGLPTDIEADACSPGYMNQEQLPFTSLLSKYMYEQFLGQGM